MSMPVKFEISVVLVGKSLKITIPKEIAKHLNLKKGDTVLMWVDNTHIIVEMKDRNLEAQKKR
jgi:AbrB family looped-hinge helix DNA binding protein